LALRDERFKEEIADALGRRVAPASKERPRKTTDKMGGN